MAGLDQPTLEALYERLETSLYNVVYRWVWDPEEARDLVQEAFLRLWGARERVVLATVEPLAYRIAVNLASNRRRQRRRWAWLGLGDDDPLAPPGADGPADAETEALARERCLALRRAVDALPERLRRVVLLTEFSELSYAQVAAALGIPPGTVGSRRNQALALLRERLGALLETRDSAGGLP